MRRERQAAQDDEIADHARRQGDDRSGLEGVLHEGVAKELLDVAQEVPSEVGRGSGGEGADDGYVSHRDGRSRPPIRRRTYGRGYLAIPRSAPRRGGSGAQW